MNETSKRRSPVERLLGVFTDVKGGEGGTALLLTLNIFLILTAYYIIKPVREALILAAPDGDQWKSYGAAGQTLLLLGAVPAYAWLVNRFPRRRLITVVTIFFASNLALFYLLVRGVGVGGLGLGLGFFLWVGVFNLMIPAQFWSFANDVYTPEQGKRLFAIVAFGASFGAFFGSKLTEWLVEPVGLEQLLLLSGLILLISLAVTLMIDARESGRPRGEAASGEKQAEEPMSTDGAFGLVLRNRYLLLIAVLLLLTNLVNTTGEFILGSTVKANVEAQAVELGIAAEERGEWVGAEIGRFYGRFFSVVNILGFAIQLFLVSRILKYLGVRIALLILPFIALGGYAILAISAVPALALVRWAKTAENATDYSLQNTVRQALFLPTTREEKYKAKQAIDTFFVRAGDLLSAGLVYAGTNLLAFSTQGFAGTVLVLVGLWILVATALGRRYRSLSTNAVE